MLKIILKSNAQTAVQALSKRLTTELQAGKKVLWLLCGGSNIPLCVEAMATIPNGLTVNLAIALTDERFGEPKHPDSNWKQLYVTGFQPQQAHIIETLRAGLSLAETCRLYDQALHEAISQADVVIAQFGIGADGHIAGLLPHAPYFNASSTPTDTPWVVGYDAGSFVRITITPPVWNHIQAAYAFVYGSTKHNILQQLQDEQLSTEEQPAQLLKILPEAYLYTDQRLTPLTTAEE